MDSILTLPALIYLCIAIYCISLIINALSKLRVYKIADYLLVIMLGLFLAILLVLFGSELSWWDLLNRGVRLNLPWYGLLLFSGVIYALTYSVFNKENPGWIWLIACIAIVLLAAAADTTEIFPGNISWGKRFRGIFPFCAFNDHSGNRLGNLCHPGEY